MKKLYSVCFIIFLFSFSAFAQKSKIKPWNEWSKKDTEKILNDSPWGQTQTDTDTSEMNYSPTSGGASSVGQSTPRNGSATSVSVNNNRADQGANNQPISVKYHVRFFSAKPIRQAFARMILLGQEKQNDQLAARLQGFIDSNYDNYIVVSVSVEASDRRFSGPAEQALGSATSGTLKNKCYLERADGKRNFVVDYVAPTTDGTGAKFIFPRMFEDKPFLNVEDGNVRFYAEFSEKMKLNTKHKVSDMIYNKKLEY